MLDFALPGGDLLIAPEQSDWVEAALNKMLSNEFAEQFNQKVKAVDAEDDDDFWNPDYAWVRPYDVKNGVLTIPVRGMLLPKCPYAFGGWLTGYEYISRAIARGVEDSNVREIVLLVDSPGGYVAGCFDCADDIHAARGTKPIRAFADESAYSAAYALASAADSINVARTGGVGSVGVIATHVEMTEYLEKSGFKATLIFAGQRKVDGHPYQPLSAEAQKRFQARVDNHYSIFVATVARNRGMEEQAVRDTEAGCFMAHEAIEIGLADAVGPLDSLSANADPQNEETDMSKDNTSAVDQAANEAAVTQARADGVEAGKVEGAKEGATAERERISTILDSEEAKTRPAAARHTALHSDMSAEAAASFLAGLPEEDKADKPGTSTFENSMNAGDHPDVGSDGDEGGEDSAESVVDQIFASAGYRKAKA